MSEKDKYGVSPLSNFDLMNTTANELKDRVNVVDLTQNLNINDVEDLFHNRGHFILFNPSDDPNEPVGHWTCCIRQQGGDRKRKDKCIYFDSYGEPLKDHRVLKILKDKYKTIEMNDKRFQQYGTNLCGFWCLFCITLNKLIKNLTLNQIKTFLESKPKNMSYDLFIGKLTEAV